MLRYTLRSHTNFKELLVMVYLFLSKPCDIHGRTHGSLSFINIKKLMSIFLVVKSRLDVFIWVQHI
jgi:hypothetical protein